MRRALAAPLALAVLGAVPADAGWNPRPVNVTVTPTEGASDTRFLVEFTARNTALGDKLYDVESTGPELEGCDSQSAIFRHARRGQRVRVRVPSRRTMPDWCPGHYEGKVFYMRENRNGDFVGDTVVGRFAFDVR